MDLSTFKEQLKTSPESGIYLFSGREDYLKGYYISQLIHAVLPNGDDGLNYMHADYAQVRTLDITDYIQALPVFCERKLFHITALDTDSPRKDMNEIMVDLTKDFPDYLIVILDRQTTDTQVRSSCYSDIKKAASDHVYELIFNEQDIDMLKRWMARHAKAYNKTLKSDTAEYLLSITDNNMLSLRNELHKICTYTQSDTITIQDIDAVTVRTIDAQIYELADAIVAGNATKCMLFTDDLLEKFPDTMVLASVYNCFSRLYRVALCKEQGLSSGEIGKRLDMKPGTVNKNLRILRSMSLNTVRQLIMICADADLELKRISRDKRKSIDIFFLRLMSHCSH